MNHSPTGSSPMFIPEIESPLFTRFFYRYVLTLYRRRFRAVWLDDREMPRTLRSTLYIGNHNSWWDALNPLLLNERVIGKRARAMMDEEQLLRYPFFRRLGVFSINRQHSRKSLASMEHAVRLLNGTGLEKRPVGLWFYPEGKLVRPETPIAAENGITWLARKLDPDRTEIVPFATHIHSMRGDKPELFVRMGAVLDPRMFDRKSGPARDQSQARHIAGIIEQLRESVRRDSAGFSGSRNVAEDSNAAEETTALAEETNAIKDRNPMDDRYAINGFRLLLGRPY